MATGGEHRIRVDGVELRARLDGGASGPWLTFSNSLASDLHLWDAQVATLGGRFRILRYDTRGHGGSEPGPENIDMDRLVADSLALLDHFRIERTHFVGISLGGMTGIGLALAAPQRLATLTLADCRADAPEAFKRQWDERCGTARQHGMAPLVDGTLARWFTPRFHERHPETVARIGAMIRATKPAGYVACANAIKSLAYKPRLGEIRTPTLLLCGRSDQPLPEAMRAMAQAIPGSRYVEIEDAAHIPNIEQPDAFLAPLDAFLASDRH